MDNGRFVPAYTFDERWTRSKIMVLSITNVRPLTFLFTCTIGIELEPN